MNKLKFIKSTLVIALGAMLLGSCMKSEDPGEPTPTAFITIFNAYSPIESVGIRMAGQDLGKLEYGDATGGYWYTMGIQNLAFLNPTGNTIIAERDITMEENTSYTALVYGKTESDRNFIFTTDVPLESSEGFPIVRFFNLANEIGEVDLFIGDDATAPLFENRAQETQGNITDSQRFILSNINGSARIIARDTEGAILAATDGPYAFQSRAHHTIVLVGDPAVDEGGDNTYEIIVY